MDLFLRIFFFVIEIITLIFIIINSKNCKGGYYKGIAVGMIIYYAVIPLVLNIIFAVGNDKVKTQILEKKGLNFIVNADLLTMILIGIMITVLFGLFSKAYNSNLMFSIGKLFSDRAVERKTKRNFNNLLILTGNICLAIGGTCTLYYMLSFGSIQTAIQLSGYVRGFTVSSTRYISYIASLMIIPAGVVVVAPWCFLLTIDYKKNTWKKIKLIVSIIFSMLFLLVKAGRAPLLIFVVSLGMPLLMRRMKHPWIFLCAVAIIFMPIVDFIDALFDNSAIASSGYDVTSYISQFAYPYRTTLSAFDIVQKYGIRWGQDFVTTFLGLLPGFNFDSTWRIVSEFLGGTMWKVTGSTPTDLFTFCILEFHVFGLLLGGVLGLICRNLDKGLQGYKAELKESTYGINALEAFVLLNSFWFVSTADFESLVRNLYFFCISILILMTTNGKSNG